MESIGAIEKKNVSSHAINISFNLFGLEINMNSDLNFFIVSVISYILYLIKTRQNKNISLINYMTIN